MTVVDSFSMENEFDLEKFACKQWIEANDEMIEHLSEFFSMFSNPTRLRILLLLSKKDMCVGKIAEILRMDQSAVSAQLKVLRHLNLVKAKRHGRYMRYKLNNKHVRNILREGFKYVLKTSQ
jgi:DNA-binding transcriptional ArsR family regulator